MLDAVSNIKLGFTEASALACRSLGHYAEASVMAEASVRSLPRLCIQQAIFLAYIYTG